MEIDDIDLNVQKEKLLENYTKKLIDINALVLEPEETQIWICYPKKEIEDLVDEMIRAKEQQQQKNQINIQQQTNQKVSQIAKQIEFDFEKNKKTSKRKSEIFLFNKLNNNCAHVMSRHKEQETSQIVKFNFSLLLS